VPSLFLERREAVIPFSWRGTLSKEMQASVGQVRCEVIYLTTFRLTTVQKGAIRKNPVFLKRRAKEDLSEV
jgi:hypothetical protein